MLTSCFEKWWIPIVFWVAALGLVIVSNWTPVPFLGIASFILLTLSLLFLFGSAVYHLVYRRWLKAILTGLLGVGTIAGIILYAVFIFAMEQLDGDKWADNLTIPTNITLNTPKEQSIISSDSIGHSTGKAFDFELYNSFQPGLYEYAIWIGKTEPGTIYLKAYEVTQEYPLSTDNLAKSSSIKIINDTDSIIQFGTKDHFTIYEGDWGKPYAARFEVWFHPDNGNPDRKLTEKIYKIEGWQR
ncbi:hypothetical protein [Xanthocytophaga agilis]|uniref:Uncharacterized protein n=1 Tax=Xanthocytophaga agilis TaxID=3048010 RepID=A0AAE3R0Q9_9BACT|nr:hypothetical protein [Xanthocytophaga agilis]MDJ1501546.1 hypothetical protein [Xanthocytophaga agilis]